MATPTDLNMAIVPTRSGRPRAADNADMHSILAAAIGLSNLGDTTSSLPSATNPGRTGSDTRGQGTATPQRVNTATNPPIDAFRNVTAPPTQLQYSRPDLNMAQTSIHLPRSSLRLPGDVHYPSPYTTGLLVGAPSASLRSMTYGSSSLHNTSYLGGLTIAERMAALDRATATHMSASASATHQPATSSMPAAGYSPHTTQHIAQGEQPGTPPLTTATSHANAPDDSGKAPTISRNFTFSCLSLEVRNNSKGIFPEILFDIISAKEYNDIISWLPHGRGFIIHDKQRFASIILAKCFDGAKFTSFTRRLKRWSFVRVARGPEIGAYYNKYFTRDDPMLVKKMKYRMDDKAKEAIKKVRGESSDDEKEDGGEQENGNMADDERATEKEGIKSQKQAVGEDITHGQMKTDSSALVSKQLELESKLQLQTSELPKRTSLKSGEPVTATATPSSEAAADTTLPVQGIYPSLLSADPDKRRLLEIEQQLLLARQGMSHGPASGIAGLHSLGSASVMPPHNPYHTSSTVSKAHRLLELAHARLLLEAERARRPGQSMSSNLHNQSSIMPKVQSASMSSGLPLPMTSRRSMESLHGERGSAHSLLQRESCPTAMPMGYSHLTRPLKGEQAAGEISSSDRGDGGSRPIMMNRKEEEEYAEFLYMKKIAESRAKNGS